MLVWRHAVIKLNNNQLPKM